MSQKSTQSIYKSDIKIIVIGLSGTGKTSFVQKWLKNVFSDNCKATIMSEYGGKVVQRRGENYRIQIWDLAGQDKNLNITKIFIKDALGYIVCADSTKTNSFDDALKWKKTIDEIALFPDQKKLPNILLQNKADLLSEEEKNDNTFLNKFAQDNSFDGSFKTSAKIGFNIDTAMDYLIDNILQRMEELAQSNQEKNVYKSGRTTVELDPSKYKVPREQIKPKNDNCC